MAAGSTRLPGRVANSGIYPPRPQIAGPSTKWKYPSNEFKPMDLGLRSAVSSKILPIFITVLYATFLLLPSASVTGEPTQFQVEQDLHNTGFVVGEGRMVQPVERYRINETEYLGLEPIIVDLEGDGSSEMVYLTNNATLKIRNALDGVLINEVDFGNRSMISPLAHDVNGDGVLDLIVVNTSSTRMFIGGLQTDYSYTSYIHFIDGKTLTEIETLVTYSAIRGGGKIFDVDGDGTDELILPIYRGEIWCIDLDDLDTDWRCIMYGPGFGRSVAIFEHEGAAKIAVTSGLWSHGHPMITTDGCNTLFIIDGATGVIEKEFDEHNTIRVVQQWDLHLRLHVW